MFQDRPRSRHGADPTFIPWNLDPGRWNHLQYIARPVKERLGRARPWNSDPDYEESSKTELPGFEFFFHKDQAGCAFVGDQIV
jgi:hypothetical protein